MQTWRDFWVGVLCMVLSVSAIISLIIVIMSALSVKGAI